MGEVLCRGGDAEEGGVGLDGDCFSVGFELEDAEPSVATVAMPSAADHLCVEHHLPDVASICIFVDAIGDGVLKVIGGLACVAAYGKHDVG